MSLNLWQVIEETLTLIVLVCLCGCVYTLFSRRLSPSAAKSAGIAALRKLLSETGTLLLIAARLACTASGGRDCGVSQPAGRD